MSLVQRLHPQLEKMKTHKALDTMTYNERRMSLMTAIIVNPKLSRTEKDKRLRDIVDEARVEKALKARGVKL